VSDTAIFAIGLFAFLLLAGGLAFTVYEIRRLNNPDSKASNGRRNRW
jgi:hypothetical protein